MNITEKLKTNYLLIFILLLGAILRFYHINFQSVWLDEIHTMNEANPNFSLAEVYRAVIAGEQIPPLYFYIVYFLFKIFGYYEIVARLFSAIVAVASLYAFYVLGKEFINKKAGLICAALLALNYFHLYYSQEARPYMFLLLFTLLSMLHLVRYLKFQKRKNALLFGVFSALMVHSHFFALFVLFSECMILLFFMVICEKENRKSFVIDCLLSGLAALVLLLPALPMFLGVTKISSFWIPAPTLDAYTLVFREIFGNSELLLAMIGIILLFYFLRIFKEKDSPITYSAIIGNKNIFSFVIIIPWIVIVMMIPLIRSYLTVPMIISRYFIVLLPAVLLLIAIAVCQLKNRMVRAAFLGLFFIFSINDIVIVKKYYKNVSKTQYREAGRFILENNPGNDPVVTALPWYVSYHLNKSKVKTTVVEKPFEDLVQEMIQDSTKRKAFWYLETRNLPLTLSESAQKFLSENFLEEKSIDLYGAWAKHYVRLSGVLQEKDISKFLPLKKENGAKINFSVEMFEIGNGGVKVSGWANLDGQDTENSRIEVLLVSGSKAFKALNQSVKRPDVTQFFNNGMNLDNSGFALERTLKNLPPGAYAVGLLVTDEKSGKSGLILTDKVFTWQ
jgi:mannosyltransferase